MKSALSFAVARALALNVIVTACLFFVLGVQGAIAQSVITEHLGLRGQDATSLSLYGGILAVGTEGNGVYWTGAPSSDTTWNHLALDSLSVQAVYAHKSGPIGWAISAGVAPEKEGSPLIYCSYLGGEFEPKSHGISVDLTNRITDFAGFPDPTICGETYAAGDRALYRRQFGDSTWHVVYGATIEGNIVTVAAKPSYPGVVFAGGADGFAGHLLVKSTDFGETWKDISPLRSVTSIDFGGANADVIFVAAYDELRRSTDDGATWETVLRATNRETITHVLYESSSKRVYAASRLFNGSALVYVSADEGTTWKSVLPDVDGAIVGMEFGGDRWIYFVTRDGGAYRIDRGAISVGVDPPGDKDARFVLGQNYPNPVVDVTTIPYSIAAPADVSIELFDLLGRRIAVWTRAHAVPGDYEVTWQGAGRSRGVYVYTAHVSDSDGLKSHARALVIK